MKICALQKCNLILVKLHKKISCMKYIKIFLVQRLLLLSAMQSMLLHWYSCHHQPQNLQTVDTWQDNTLIQRSKGVKKSLRVTLASGKFHDCAAAIPAKLEFLDAES